MKDDLPRERYSPLDNPTGVYPRLQMAELFEDSEEVPVETASSNAGLSLLYFMIALFGGTLLAVGLAGLLAVLFYVL